MRPEQIAAGFLITGFFVSLCAWIKVVWPERNPLADETWDRRNQAHEHFRR